MYFELLLTHLGLFCFLDALTHFHYKMFFFILGNIFCFYNFVCKFTDVFFCSLLLILPRRILISEIWFVFMSFTFFLNKFMFSFTSLSTLNIFIMVDFKSLLSSLSFQVLFLLTDFFFQVMLYFCVPWHI